jgi:hypothetical protein
MTLERMNLIACLAFAALAASIIYAESHEAPSGWEYPLACCSNRDCRQIDASMVSVTAAGYQFTIPAGYHNMAPNGGVYLVAYGKARVSPDGEFHLCLSPRENVLCAFAPPPGS